MNDAGQLQLETEPISDGMILRAAGDIDLSCAPALQQELARLQSDKPERLIIDLHGVPYMDSSGLATLVEAMQITRRRGGRLILCQLQEKVRSIFEIARLDTVFTIVESCDEATSA